MGFDFAGIDTKVVLHKVVEYTFDDRSAQVQFVSSPSGVTVRATFDPETTHSVEQQRDGWQAILNNFKHYTEAKH